MVLVEAGIALAVLGSIYVAYVIAKDEDILNSDTSTATSATGTSTGGSGGSPGSSGPGSGIDLDMPSTTSSTDTSSIMGSIKEKLELAGEEDEEVEENISEIEESLETVKKELEQVRQEEQQVSLGKKIDSIRENNNLAPGVRNDLVKLKHNADEDEELFKELKRVLKEERVTLRELEDILSKELEMEQEFEQVFTDYQGCKEMEQRLIQEGEKWREKKEELVQYLDGGQGNPQEICKQLEVLMYNFYELNGELKDLRARINTLESEVENISSNLGFEKEIEDAEGKVEKVVSDLEHSEKRTERFEKFREIESKGSGPSDIVKAEKIAQDVAETARDEFADVEKEEETSELLGDSTKNLQGAWSDMNESYKALKNKVAGLSDRNLKEIKKAKKANKQIARVLKRRGYNFDENKCFLRNPDKWTQRKTN